MLMALTGTPSTSNRAVAGATVMSDGMGIDVLALRIGERVPDLLLDPGVGPRQTVLERDLRLPAEHLAQPGVVRVAAAHALRPGDVARVTAIAGAVGNDVGQPVDADQPILTEVQRLG